MACGADGDPEDAVDEGDPVFPGSGLDEAVDGDVLEVGVLPAVELAPELQPEARRASVTRAPAPKDVVDRMGPT